MAILTKRDKLLDNPGEPLNAVPNILWAGLIVAVTAISIGLRYTSLLHHDVAWGLYLAGEILDGSTIYVDLIEVNPPIIFFLKTLPVILAKWASLTPSTVFPAFVFVLATGASAFSYRLLHNISSINRKFFLLLMLIALFLLPRGDFGQREHLMIIFVLPYIALAIRRIEKRPCSAIIAFSVGVLATFGFGLKPHFLLIPAALEVYFLTRTRLFSGMFRPETIALGLGLLTYIGAIFLFTPEYFTVIIPFALEVYNQAYNNPILRVIFRLELLLIVLLSVMGSLMRKEGSTLPSAVVILFLVGCASFVIYVVQMKGWSYQHYPALAFLFMATGLLVIEWKSHINAQLTRGLAYFAGAVVLIGLPFISIIKYKYESPFVDAVRKEITSNGSEKSFFVFTTNLSAGFPLTNITGVKWASRFPTLWLLPGIIRERAINAGKPLPKIDAIEQYNMNAVIEDLTKFKPDLIIVDVRDEKPYFGGIKFNYIEYFSKDHRFKAIWSQYRKTSYSKFGFDFYRLKK